MGADVVKLEPPTGDEARRRGPFPGAQADPEASGLFLALNSNKRSVTADLNTLDGRRSLDQLVAWADVVIHNIPVTEMSSLEIDHDDWMRRRPDLVSCSITPFGLSGPHAEYNAYELNVAHGGGWAYLSPGASDRPDQPPLKAFGQQADFLAGAAAAFATLAAYFRASTTRQGTHIDISVQEVVASILEQTIPRNVCLSQVASRLGRRHVYPWGFFPCSDGLVHIFVNEQDQWLRLVELMGSPEWATWEVFRDAYARGEAWDVLQPRIGEWTSEWKVRDLFLAAQERRICVVPVHGMKELSEEPHLRERNFFVSVPHPKAGTFEYLGAPYQLENGGWSIDRPAPLLGEHNADVGDLSARITSSANERTASRPLEGIRVLEFGWAWAGPFTTMMLSHLGAEVIKIESERRLDVTRRIPIVPPGLERGPNAAAIFNEWNLGKKSLLLDLKSPGACEVALRLVDVSDVVLDNFATGVMDRLGLSHEQLLRRKPSLIVASISGFGHTGPERSFMAYGAATVPLSGLASVTGHETAPSETGISYGDPAGGFHTAVAISAALIARQKTELGASIDLSLWESVTALLAEAWMPHAMNGEQSSARGNHDSLMAPHNCYRSAGDDQWVTIACSTDREWRSLADVLSDGALADDKRFATAAARKANEPSLDTLISAWTSSRDNWDVTHQLQAVGVAAFPSMSSADLMNDDHLRQRGFFVRARDPDGAERLHAGIPWKMDYLREPQSGAPRLGEHTTQILSDILGYSRADINLLRERGVLA
jgi:crotonobetainyl-CoA:carnitine CoA-transferase CaiB-like acyl-CoA transferase